MTTEAQAAAYARLAADTKRACATSADIVKAAKAKAAAKAAHAAQATQAAQVAQAEAAQATKVAKVAKVAKTSKVAVSPAAKGFSFYAKAAFLTHPVYFSAAGGVIAGIVAYHLVNKYWLNER